jgi:DNA recombination protein RmuC
MRMDIAMLMLVMAAAGLLGLAAGWLAWGRTAASIRADRDKYLQNLKDAIKDIDVEKQRAERIPLLEAELAQVRDGRAEAEKALARLEAGQAEREQGYKDQIAALVQAKEALSAQFSEVGAKLLGEAQRAFLERADQRFQQAGEKSEAQLKALLNPVESTLKRYEEGLAKVEKERVGTYSELKEAVAQLAQGNDLVRRETSRLANVMRSSPKARGRWGEEQLRTILEAAGLAENVDFSLQSSISDGERQLRPDCVINLPGGRCIVVDVKCPLVHFEQAFDEEDEERRLALLLQHAAAMKSYANDLGRKGYWKQFDLSPDFVIMFVPGEHFLSAAAERAPDLIESAFRNGVILASTINMLALAKVMAGMWRQEKLAEEAEKIGALGKELYARLLTMGGHVAKLGRNLNLAAGAYNDFVGSLESKVMTQAKRFEDLKIDTGGKSIELLPIADTSVRPLTKLLVEDRTEEAAE